jgi:hypothetical protein
MISRFFAHRSLLHTVLRFNAGFSGLFGLLFLILPGTFAGILGVESHLAIRIAGAGLLIWELFVSFIVMAEKISPTLVWIVILGDLVWVVGSAALLLGGWLPMTTSGKWFIAIIADIVLLFAVVQFFGLRKLASK